MGTKRPTQMTERQAGFSLTELIVAIAIMGVLALLVMPVMNAATNRAQMSKCMNNLRQIGVATHRYAADNNGCLPAPSMEVDGVTRPNMTAYVYNTAIAGLLVNGKYAEHDIFFCPADLTRSRARENGNGWARDVEKGGTSFNRSGYWQFYVRAGSRNNSTEKKFADRARITDSPRAIIAFDQMKSAGLSSFHRDEGINVLRLGGSVDYIPARDLDTSKGIDALLPHDARR